MGYIDGTGKCYSTIYNIHGSYGIWHASNLNSFNGGFSGLPYPTIAFCTHTSTIQIGHRASSLWKWSRSTPGASLGSLWIQESSVLAMSLVKINIDRSLVIEQLVLPGGDILTYFNQR